MSKIPYRYRTPIPMIFWKTGILDPSKKIYKNRLAFLTWTFSLCHHDSFQFSCSREEASKQSGLTEDEWRTQEEYFINEEFLEKRPNPSKNRSNQYVWRVEKLGESKIIEIEKSPNQNETQVIDKQDGCEKIPNQIPQPSEKIPNQIPEKSPTILRVENEKNPQPIPNETPMFNKQINNKTICLKETSKEKSQSDVSDENLFLFSEEKKLNNSSKEEDVSVIEAYLNFRNVNGITIPAVRRWLNKYSLDEVIESITLMLQPSKIPVRNPGGWVEKALQTGIAKNERIKKQNMQIAKELQSKNKYLRLHSRYCYDLRNKDREFYYHINPEIFQNELRKCL